MDNLPQNPEQNLPVIRKLIIVIAILGGLYGGFYALNQWARCKQWWPLYNFLDSCMHVVNDTTSDWQTYRNEEYGFEVEYPPYFIGAGDFAKNSVLGTVNKPVRGVFVGPLVFIIAESDQNLKNSMVDYFNNFARRANATPNPSPNAIPDLICNLNTYSNTQFSAQIVSCSGEGGPASYGIIQGENISIFIDGYSGGYDGSNKQRIDIQHYRYGENLLNQILSTFKFTR